MNDNLDNNSKPPFNPFTTSSDQNNLNNNFQSQSIGVSTEDPINMSSSQGQPNEENIQDERIVEYLISQVIPARNPNMPVDEVIKEKDRLYKILEAGIFETAYKQLAEDQKNELDTLMKYGANIPAIQAFFIEKIPDIQNQLGKYMQNFVESYLRGEI